MKNHSIRKQLVGTVVSDRMNRTVVVRVERLTQHVRYKKYIKTCSKVSVHDADNACCIGDKVIIAESKPISKTKRWRVSSILEKAA